MPVIRWGTKEDIVKVSRLWFDMVKEMRPQWSPNMGWWREIANRNYDSGKYHVCVAEDGGKIVGFLDYFLFPEPSDGKVHAVGQHFYVRPEYRNKRTAWSIYHKVIKRTETEADVLSLFCFPKEEQFWGKRGFVPARTMMRMEV